MKDISVGEEIAVVGRKLTSIGTSSDFYPFYKNNFPFDKEGNAIFSYSKTMGAGGRLMRGSARIRGLARVALFLSFFQIWC
ncbi:MAG: hypothetical protein KJ569_08100 [Candidatus Omnitrophica bacterium]|nr:hypothetical protein [Candidatus Omnitrophota bacterium]